MAENLFEAQYDITKKSKLKKFYESNKILIFSFALILIISLVSFGFYLESREKKKILLAENYIQAKIYLERGNTNKAGLRCFLRPKIKAATLKLATIISKIKITR